MSRWTLLSLFVLASFTARGAILPSNYHELDSIHQKLKQAFSTDIEGAGWDGPCYFESARHDSISESAFFYGVGQNLRTIFVWDSMGNIENASRHYHEVEWAAQPYARWQGGLSVTTDEVSGTKILLHKFNEPDNGWMICTLTLRHRYL